MQTQCASCGKVLSNPTVAAKHILRHDPTRRTGRSRWGTDAYVDRERWGAYASRTVPPNHAQMRAGGGPDSTVSGADVIQHSALRWDETECICDDHYPVIPAWQMTAAGQGIEAHRHRDIDGRCVVCGGERDRD